MGNVTETVRARILRLRTSVLLNFCRSVVQPQDEQLRVAMAEYEEALSREQERKAA